MKKGNAKIPRLTSFFAKAIDNVNRPSLFQKRQNSTGTNLLIRLKAKHSLIVSYFEPTS